MIPLEERRRIVEASYARHGHRVEEWLSHSAVPVRTTRTREDAVCGSVAWKAAALELGGGPKKERRKP